MGQADLASLFQPKTLSGTFWSETPRRGSPASRPYSIFGEWNHCQDVSGPEGWTTPSERLPPPTDSQPPPRISGDAAFDKDILGSVSEQIQKNFARTHWKVSVGCDPWTRGPVQLEAAPPPLPAPSFRLWGMAWAASGLCGPPSGGARDEA